MNVLRFFFRKFCSSTAILLDRRSTLSLQVSVDLADFLTGLRLDSYSAIQSIPCSRWRESSVDYCLRLPKARFIARSSLKPHHFSRWYRVSMNALRMKFCTDKRFQLMDCFLMVLDPEGDVLYVSETISIYLGLSQVDMTGNSITEYIHPEDWPQFHTVFCSCSCCDWSEMCTVRVKSSLTKRANKKDSLRASPGFKVLRMDMTFCHGCRLVVCSPLPSPILSSILIRPSAFVITTGIDLSITFFRAEEMFHEYQCCSSLGLKGLSFYSIVHVDDAEIVRKMHVEGLLPIHKFYTFD
ncbi:unnamed protein product [Heligmosomoides polygyrus]|uniref:PAS domain-containing protein n=1 Tax=Heligmosomoides polygyrus TaxID=6339 RepID=A0A183GIU2_HELPZ|nr:unnamed protein product [Heligmosomoides polygyrus]